MPRKLKPEQREVAIQLARGMLPYDIEHKRNMNHGTIAKWKRIPAFLDEIERYAREYEESLVYVTRTLPYTAVCRLRDSDKIHDVKYLEQSMELLKRRKHVFNPDTPHRESEQDLIRDLANTIRAMEKKTGKTLHLEDTFEQNSSKLVDPAPQAVE